MPRTTRMYVLDRPRPGSFTMVGESARVYQVDLTREGSKCNCPAALFAKRETRKRCKHQMFILHRVLGKQDLTQEHHALPEIDTWLQECDPFSSQTTIDAGLLEAFEKLMKEPTSNTPKTTPKNSDDPCPICYEDISPEDPSVCHCEVQCGTRFHRACMDRWMQVKGARQSTCPYCRVAWKRAETRHRGGGSAPQIDPLTGKILYMELSAVSG